MKHLLILICFVLLVSCSSHDPSVGYTKDKAFNAQMVSDVYFIINRRPALAEAVERHLNAGGPLPAEFSNLKQKAGESYSEILKDGLDTYKNKDGR
jgi:hypothetical protein